MLPNARSKRFSPRFDLLGRATIHLRGGAERGRSLRRCLRRMPSRRRPRRIRAGVAQGVMTYHFPTRRRLLTEAFLRLYVSSNAYLH